MKETTFSVKQAAAKIQKPREILRLVILVLIFLKLRINMIASMAGVNRATVFRTRKSYKMINNLYLKDKQRTGRKPKTTKEFEKLLLDAVLTPPRALGYPRNYWTLKLLKEHMQKVTRITVSKSTIRRALERNDIYCRRPKQRIHSPDPEYLVKKAKIEKLVKNPPKGAVVLYLDEHDAHLNPSIRRCYQKRGMQQKVYTPGQNQKLYIFGAYSRNQEAIVAWRIYNRKRSEEFFLFVQYLSHVFNGKRLILILDNFIIHKSKRLEKSLNAHPKIASKIEFVFLPTYSPELNPIERDWGTLKAWAESNYLFEDIKEYEEALEETLKSLLEEKKKLLSKVSKKVA